MPDESPIAPTEDSAPVESAVEQAPPPSRRTRLIRFGLAGLICLIAGLAGGIGISVRAKPHDRETVGEQGPWRPEIAWSAGNSPPPEPEPRTEFERIDRVIRSGDFARGLKLCRTARVEGESNGPLDYREGLCREGLEEFHKAAKAYERAANLDSDSPIWAWAVLGRARCAIAANELGTAHELLNQVSLRSGRVLAAAKYVLDECLYLRGRLLVGALHAPNTPDPLDSNDFAWPPISGKFDSSLERLATHLDSTPPERDVSIPVSNPGPLEPAESPISVHWPTRPVAKVLQDLGNLVGIGIVVEAAAEPRMANNTAAIEVANAPIAEVLTAVTEPLGLGWRTDGTVLSISLAPKPMRPALRHGTRDALRRALGCDAEHPFARSAEAWLTIIECENGRTAAAGRAFRRMLVDVPYSSESVFAAYNLGLIELRSSNLKSARSRFFDVVDRGPGTRWEDIGWWWIGRTYLDAGDWEGANRPLEKALGGTTPEIRSAAALGLCAVHMLDGDEASARRVLRTHKIGSWPSHVATNEMLSAILHYHVRPTENRQSIVEAAVRDARDGEALGPVGLLLAGQAYRDVDNFEHMVEIYESAVESTRGPIAIRMTFAVAERKLQLDQWTAARSRYLAVVAADPDGLGPRAQLRLAELNAREGLGTECIRRCRSIVDKPGIELEDVLPVLGRGYELVRDYRRAAEAFAGRLPSE